MRQTIRITGGGTYAVDQSVGAGVELDEASQAREALGQVWSQSVVIHVQRRQCRQLSEVRGERPAMMINEQ